LDSFDFDAVPIVRKAQIIALAAGDSWPDQGANLTFFGPPSSHHNAHLFSVTEVDQRAKRRTPGVFNALRRITQGALVGWSVPDGTQQSTIPTKALGMAFPMRPASAASRNANERSAESRWMSAEWTKRKTSSAPVRRQHFRGLARNMAILCKAE
jgi:hypothetical protein